MIEVTAAEPGHLIIMTDLLEEMNRFYGSTSTEPASARARQVEDALFGNPPKAFAVLAWDGGSLCGFASYSFLWPAVGLTSSLFLKELYVAEGRRRALLTVP